MTKNENRSKRQPVTRHGKLLGGYVPTPIAEAIEEWCTLGDERNASTFLRAAAKEKLIRDGIRIMEAAR